MTHDQYAALVSRLESMAETNPTSYKTRVGALAILGYAYALGVMLLLTAALTLIVWGLIETHAVILVGKLALPVLALLAALGKAFWVTVAPPDGRELRKEEAPILFEEIAEVRRVARAPAPHHVILTDELNASVHQVPRLGIFGWHRNYLVVGLPLLVSLTPDQFRSVLAHEFGHLSGSHARFGNWIYRVRGTWRQIEVALHQRRSRLGTLLVNKFVDWYEPYFRAYSFVLARRHEIEADHTAGAVAGSQVAAMALAAITLRERYQNEVVWPSILARIPGEPTPPPAAYSGFIQRMHAQLPLPQSSGWLAAALRVESGVDDPHPALADRLTSLGALPRDEASIEAMAAQLARQIDLGSTAAAHYLGSLAIALTTELDDRWRGKASPSWNDRHVKLVRARQGLSELLARVTERPLTPDERFLVADWTEDLEGVDAALPLVTTLVEECPTHVSALFMLGRILLARNDDAGVEYSERAMQLDPKATGYASAMIARHLEQVGRRQESITYRVRAEALIADQAAAAAERTNIHPKDKVATAELDDAARARLREQLAHYPRVGRAWIGRKVTHHAPDKPYYVLAVATADAWWRFVSEGSRTYLARKLAEELDVPPGTLIVVIDRKRQWLRRALKKVANSEVYRRGR